MAEIFNLNIKIKTPLHIGDNETRKWSAFSDYIVENGRIRFVEAKKLDNLLAGDQKLMEAYLRMIRQSRRKAALEYSLSVFLAEQNIAAERILGHKSLPISGTIEGQEIHPFISQNGQPFIPGSSLKGAIRSAMVFDYLKHNANFKQRVLDYMLRPTKKPEMSKFEKEIFGDNPHKDLLRFLRVGDSTPVSGEQSVVQTTYTFHLKRGYAKIPITIECLIPGAEASLRINKLPLNKEVHQRGYRVKFEKLERKKDLFKLLNEFSQEFTEREIRELTGKPGLEQVVNFYLQLKSEIVAEKNEKAFVMLGAGAGIFSKTVLLSFSAAEIKRIRAAMKNTKVNRNFGWQNRKHSSLFPVTRHVYKERETVAGVLGWIEIS